MTFDEYIESLDLPDSEWTDFFIRGARLGWDQGLLEANRICKETDPDRTDFSLLVRGKMLELMTERK